MMKDVSEEEWQVRCDLAATYRLVALHGWDDLIFTHLTARVPGPDDHFLINPYGLMFEEVTASSLLKVDLEGNKIIDSPYPFNAAGFTIHSAVHSAREDAKCVLHLHTKAGVGVSAQAGGLLPISQQSSVVLASLAYHDYEGIALNPEECKRIQNDLGNKKFLILRNHGTLTVGESIPDAFLFMYVLETACQVQIAAQSGKAELISVDQKILDGVEKNVDAVLEGAGGQLAWPALLRKLERMGSNYKD